MNIKYLFFALLFGSACMVGSGIPSALGAALHTYTVSHGMQCRAAPGQYNHFLRDQRGIQNNQTSSRRVYCPLNTPSYDSDREQNPKLKRADVYINRSGMAPTCYIYTISQAGSALWSPPGTEGYYGGRLVSFNFNPNGFASADGRTASIGYVCDVPANGRIHGAIANFAISKIDQGQR